jgi:hypothetical protein
VHADARMVRGETLSNYGVLAFVIPAGGTLASQQRTRFRKVQTRAPRKKR